MHEGSFSAMEAIWIAFLLFHLFSALLICSETMSHARKLGMDYVHCQG